MKFDVFRDSDCRDGRAGRDVPAPIEGAVFNTEENRWELEVRDLGHLLDILEGLGHPVTIMHGCTDCDDLPVLAVCDVDECDPEIDDRELQHALN